jgi:hypothetical protein
LLDDFKAGAPYARFDFFRRAANAPDASPPEAWEQKIGQSGFQAIQHTGATRIELEISDAALVQQSANHMQVALNDRELRDVLKNEERIDEVAGFRVFTGLLQEVLGS